LHPVTGHIIKSLNPETLREGFLVYTREAFAMLPGIDNPHILDIGCGSGMVTRELATLSRGRVTGIDIDKQALDELNLKIECNGLSDRVMAVHCSLFKTGFQDKTFDLAWDEGTLHLLDSGKSAPEINRLLKPGGFLVMNETINWLKIHLSIFETHKLKMRDQVVLPEKLWWNHYYAPLENRIRKLTSLQTESAELKKLKPLEREIEMVKKDPRKFDCAFFILEKIG
jgi:ubiquinone/menaquinone biosynthesis C-methylase UbiE